MRTLWAILLGGLALVGTAEARLGDNKKQVVENYGQPLKEETQAPYETIVCEKDGYNYWFKLYDGKVDQMIVTKLGNGLSEDEVDVILKQNSSGKGFEIKVKNDGCIVYDETDSKRLATWWKLSNKVVLMTKAAAERGLAKLPKGSLEQIEQIQKELKEKADGSSELSSERP